MPRRSAHASSCQCGPVRFAARATSRDGAKIKGTNGAWKQRSGNGAGKRRLETSLGNVAWKRRLETSLGNVAWKRRLETSRGNVASKRRLETSLGRNAGSKRRSEGAPLGDVVWRRRLNAVSKRRF